MKKIHEERLLRLATFLEEKVEPERFNMDHWFDGDFEKNTCGTTACALGWATVVFPRSLKMVKAYGVSHVEHIRSGRHGAAAAVAFFGLDQWIADFIFCGPSGTPQKVAHRIRRLVENMDIFVEMLQHEHNA